MDTKEIPACVLTLCTQSADLYAYVISLAYA